MTRTTSVNMWRIKTVYCNYFLKGRSHELSQQQPDVVALKSVKLAVLQFSILYFSCRFALYQLFHVTLHSDFKSNGVN